MQPTAYLSSQVTHRGCPPVQGSPRRRDAPRGKGQINSRGGQHRAFRYAGRHGPRAVQVPGGDEEMREQRVPLLAHEGGLTACGERRAQVVESSARPVLQCDQPGLQHLFQVGVDARAHASAHMDLGVGEAAPRVVWLDAVEVDQREGQVRMRRPQVIGQPDRPGLLDRGPRQPHGLRAAALPGADQGQGAQHVDVPDDVAGPGQRPSVLQHVSRAVEVAGEEARQTRGVFGDGLDGVGSPDAEEVDDLIRVEPLQGDAHPISDLQDLRRRQVAEDQEGRERVGCGPLPQGEIGTAAEPAMGLGRCRPLTRSQLGGEQADLDLGRAVGFLGSDGAQPTREGCGLTPLDEVVADAGDDSERPGRVAGIEQMADRFLLMPVSQQPPGGPVVQGAHRVRVFDPQPGSQRVGEEVLIAEGRAGLVQGDEKHRPVEEPVKHSRGDLQARDGVAQIGRQPVEDGGLQEELAHGWLLLVDHLVQQVLRDQVVTAGERLDEPRDVPRGSQRDRGQLQPCRPPVGALDEERHLRIGEGGSRHVLQQGLGVGLRKRQIGPADLDQPVVQPKLVQRPGRVTPHRHDPAGCRRQGGEEVPQVADHGVVGQLVGVLKDKNAVVWCRGESVQQGIDEGVAEGRLTGRGEAGEARIDLRRHRADRRHQVACEDRDVGMPRGQGQHGHPLAGGGGQPLTDEHRLA